MNSRIVLYVPSEVLEEYQKKCLEKIVLEVENHVGTMKIERVIQPAPGHAVSVCLLGVTLDENVAEAIALAVVNILRLNMWIRPVMCTVANDGFSVSCELSTRSH